MIQSQPDESHHGQTDLHGKGGWFVSVISKLVLILVCSRLFAADWIAEDGWWLSWLSMAGFVWVVSRAKPIEAGVYGLIMGLIGLGTSFWWAQNMLSYVMNDEGYLPKVVFGSLIAWESMVFVAVGCSIASLRKKYTNSVGLLVPMCLWIVAEAYLPRIFRWSLGHSQLGSIPLVQTAEIGGPSMVSIVVLAAACVPTLFFDWYLAKGTLRSRVASRGLVVAISIVVVSLAYGYFRLWSFDLSVETSLRVGVVQEDPADIEGILRMSARSRLLAPIDLLVWPESTLGTHAFSLKSFRDSEQVLKLSKPPFINPEPIIGMSCPLMVGGRSFNGTPNQSVPEYQTAFLLNTEGSILDRYHKRSLMPLGEYVPGEKTMPWLHDLFQLGQYIENGISAQPFALPTGERIGVIICYEDTMSEITRQSVNAGAQLLVCIINDSAFDSPVALRQHLKLSRLRAIENRRSLIRCAGTGVSCVVDPFGNLHHALDANETGAFVAEVPILDGMTLFQLLGEWPPLVALSIVLGFLVLDHLRTRRKLVSASIQN
jgi:apolipoprotein N-acyltransferase